MSDEINLLKEVNKESEKEIKYKKYAGFLSPIILVIFVIVVVVIFAIDINRRQLNSDLENKIKISNDQIQSLSEIESYQKGAKIKIQTISQIISQQIDYDRIIKEINEIQPPEIELLSMSLANTGLISVSYKIANSDMFSQLISRLTDPKIGQKYFEAPVLKGVFFNKESNYTANLNFYIK